MLLGAPAAEQPPPIRAGHGFVRMAEVPHGPSRSSRAPISLGKEPGVCQPAPACPDRIHTPGSARLPWGQGAVALCSAGTPLPPAVSLAHPRGAGVTAASIITGGMENLGVPAACPPRAVQLPERGASHAPMSCHHLCQEDSGSSTLLGYPERVQTGCPAREIPASPFCWD